MERDRNKSAGLTERERTRKSDKQRKREEKGDNERYNDKRMEGKKWEGGGELVINEDKNR